MANDLAPSNLRELKSPSSDPLKDAVRAVFSAAQMDYGTRFLSQFASDAERNAWKHRFYRMVAGIDPSDVIDGYDRAAQECAPHVPGLREIVSAVHQLRANRLRNEYDIKQASTPRIPAGSGIAGVVEHLAAQNEGNTVAEGCIEMMREILARPAEKTDEERNARLDRALSAHSKLLSMAPRVEHRGEAKQCPVCGKPGRIAKTTHADSTTPYFCVEHFRNA